MSATIAPIRRRTPRLDHSADAPVIRVNGVSRWFGSVVAVSDVSFDVRPGITGLLGPNGAGKTTLFRMITGLAATSTGTVTVFGEPVRDNPPLYARLGVMSEHETVYGFMTGREFVMAMAKLRGVATCATATDRAIELRGSRRRAASQDGHVLARHAATHASRGAHSCTTPTFSSSTSR